MSDSLTRLAADLADDTMAVMKQTGDDRLFMEVAQVIGTASQTLEEAYLTEVRCGWQRSRAGSFWKRP